jgi:hypothetical protein
MSTTETTKPARKPLSKAMTPSQRRVLEAWQNDERHTQVSRVTRCRGSRDIRVRFSNGHSAIFLVTIGPGGKETATIERSLAA